ncbi:MAG: HAMP domain-containing histidine kinase [Clostridium sp.]|nr:HAMP domain-containing histidine kinase [Clostridium sp.]
MVILFIVLCLISIFNFLLFLFLKKDIKKINSQIIYKNKTESHFYVTSSTSFKEIKTLCNSVNELYEKMQKKDEIALKKEKEMQNLMSGISHDIRTPLTSMQGYLELLKESNDYKEKEKYIDIMEFRLNSLKSILEDLFTHSKLSDNDYKIELEDINIYLLICKILASHYKDFEERNIEPHIEFENKNLTVKGNTEIIIRIVQNLINNALKHGGNYFCICENGGKLCFKNNIIEGDNLEIDKLFDRFYKSDKSRHVNSTGLGLSIVKEMVEVLGWNIKAYKKEDILSIEINCL